MNSKNQTILIIEDAPADDEAFRSILGSDHRLLFAAGRQDAFEIEGRQDLDLILLDHDTPGVDAGEISSRLNANPANRNTKILLMVKQEQVGDLGDLPAGVADCIAKPLHPALLLARLHCHLELKGYRDLWDSATRESRRVGAGSPSKLDFLLTREWQRALRNQTPISLILIDIDFFKEFEAHKGRAAGDNCLRLVRMALRECVKREVDFIARFETHAFVCLLPDTDADGAHRVCQLIQEKVTKMNIPNPCSSMAERVTLSIGVATVKPTFKLDQNYLLHQAETLLEETRIHSHDQARNWQS